jgi:hypothetical protein
MKRKMVSSLFFALCVAASAFSQSTDENLFEKVEIKFELQGEPSSEEVGFNDLRSSWKVEYQLFLSDWDRLKKLGRCGVKESASSREYCSDTIDKKLDKGIKKIALFVSKGKFTKNQLASDPNREIIETVKFTPEVINIFNEASKIYQKNPVFVFFVKTSISTRDRAGKKVKKKYTTEGLHWLKIYKADGSFDYWNVAKLSHTLNIVKKEDGTLALRKGYTHVGSINRSAFRSKY